MKKIILLIQIAIAIFCNSLSAQQAEYHLKTAPYLLSSNISSIGKDTQGNLWLGHFEGITVVKKETLPTKNIIEESIDFQVYPNPTSGLFRIFPIPKSDNLSKYIIYDVQGKVISAGNSLPETIDLQAFANGVYLLQMEDKMIKIVKQ